MKNTHIQRNKQHKIVSNIKDTQNHPFLSILNSPELASILADELPAYRSRQFPPQETLELFMRQVMDDDGSCQNVVNNAVVQKVLNRRLRLSTSTGAYCRARQKLPSRMLSRLVQKTSQLSYEKLPEEWLWQGRRICVVDGTTVTLADTAKNQIEYPQSGTQKIGLGFPLCRVVGLFCLSSGTLMNAAFGKTKGKGSTEQSLVREIANSLKNGDVLLADAFYSTYFFLAWLIENGIDAVFAQHGSRCLKTDFRTGKKVGKKDHIIEYKRPKKPSWMPESTYDKTAKKITIRELKVDNKTLITTMLKTHQAPKNALKKLYKKRWQVEVNFRDIKTTLGMETLRCKAPEMIQKELWVYFLTYNTLRLLMAEAAYTHSQFPMNLSFKHTLQLWRACLYRNFGKGKNNIEKLLIAIAENTVGNRCGRAEPRAVKRRPKPTPLLTKPRDQARADILKSFGKAA